MSIKVDETLNSNPLVKTADAFIYNAMHTHEPDILIQNKVGKGVTITWTR